MAQLQEIFQSFQCQICMNEYNKINLPRIVCRNDHIICKICLDSLHGALCPFCKQRLRYNDDYKQLFKIKEATKKVLERQRQYSNEIYDLERRVEKLVVENKDLIIFKQEFREALGQNEFGFNIDQIPKQDESLDRKFGYLTDKIKQGIQVLNQKAKKMANLKDQLIKIQMKVKDITEKFSIQKKKSGELYQELQDLKGHVEYLNRLIQSLRTEIQILEQEKANLVKELKFLEEQHNQDFQDMKRQQRQYYDFKLKMIKQRQYQRFEQNTKEKVREMLINIESLELKDKEHVLQKQVLTTQIVLLNRKFQKQKVNYNSKYQQILSEKQLAQQKSAKFIMERQNLQNELKGQIQVLKQQKSTIISQKQEMLTELKTKDDKYQLITKLNQQLKSKLIAHEAIIEKLLSGNFHQIQQLDIQQRAQLKLLKAQMVQLNKDFGEINQQINEIEDYKQNQRNYKAQLDKLIQKRLQLNDQTNRNIKDKLQKLLALCYNGSHLEFGQEQLTKFKGSLKSYCKCSECKLSQMQAFISFAKKRIGALMKESKSIQEKNESLTQLSKQLDFKVYLAQQSIQFLKSQYEQQQQSHIEAIEKYKAAQGYFLRKILQLENSIEQKMLENNDIRQQLEADHYASSKIHQEQINKELLLRDEVYHLKEQNVKLTKKLAQCSPRSQDVSSQFKNTSKDQINAIHQQKSGRQQSFSKITSVIVDKLDECNKQIQQISGNQKDLKTNYEKCLQITTSIKQIQLEKKRVKSVHNPLMISKYERHVNLYPCKFSKYQILNFSKQNSNNQNVSHEQNSNKLSPSQARPVSREYMQGSCSYKIDDSFPKLSTARKINKSHRSIESLILSQKERMKKVD